MTPQDTEFPVEDSDTRSVAIFGGGIAGMYCALQLGRRGETVHLFEASADHLGGRIRTCDMDGFLAEYGPMRYEPGVQPKLEHLVEKVLGLEMVPFVGPDAGAIDSPRYSLPPEESGPVEKPYNSLELLKRGILRILGRPGKPRSEEEQTWIDAQGEAEYEVLRRTARLDDQPLHAMGFWNALSADGVLSHQALMKIRDTGTFYHLIPENVNAAEWTVWWLRVFRTEGKVMKSVAGGSQEITRKLKGLLDGMPNVQVVPGARLESLRSSSVGVEYRVVWRAQPVGRTARHAILALPKAALEKLGSSLPAKIRESLSSVEGHGLTKMFFVTDDPYWDKDTPPQYRAHLMPTREVHYQFRESDGHGMVLVYTDKPATEFWNLYVVDGEPRDRPQIDANPLLLKQFARFLAKDVLAALDGGDGGGPTLTAAAAQRFAGSSEAEIAAAIEASVVTYGIQDWAHEPHGGAFHAWRPGAKSWEVRERYRAFSLGSGGPENVHVCGEAYSDYQGFIEGALRSADEALARIP